MSNNKRIVEEAPLDKFRVGFEIELAVLRSENNSNYFSECDDPDEQEAREEIHTRAAADLREDSEILELDEDKGFSLDAFVKSSKDLKKIRTIAKEHKITIKRDGSIRPCGVEIVLPPLDLPLALDLLEKIFEVIQEEGSELSTNYSTGLHFGISFADDSKQTSINYKKLLALIPQTEILAKFGRVNSYYARPSTIKTRLDYVKVTSEICQDKYHAVHPHEPVGYGPYTEIRMLGGADYELQFEAVLKTVLVVARAMSMSVDKRFSGIVPCKYSTRKEHAMVCKCRSCALALDPTKLERLKTKKVLPLLIDF